MTTTIHPNAHPQVAAVHSGRLRVGEAVTNRHDLGRWFTLYPTLEFAVLERRRARLTVSIAQRDGSLRVLPRIIRTEPHHRSPNNEGPNDGRRSWECIVGLPNGPTDMRLVEGFFSKIECTLAARGWFIAYGISPDSPGGWN